MPVTEMIVMVAVFAAAVLAAVHVLRVITTLIVHRTIRRAIDRDPAAAEPLIAQISAPAADKTDDRTATLLIAFGVSMVAASLVIGDPGWMHYGIAGALFPLIIGTALWLRHWAVQRRLRADGAGGQ